MLKKIIPPSVKQRVKLALHSGNKYECPICGFKAKDWYPIGFDIPVLKAKQVIGAGRRNGGCYKCNSSDRVRLLYTYLRDKINLFKGSKDVKILHIAPEENISKVLLDSGFKHYICGDLFTEGYNYPDHVQNIDVTSIPFEDNYFEIILCNHVLEHVPNDIKAMKELYRVLKKGGKAILQVPISKNSHETIEDFSVTEPTEREVVFGQYDHVRIYGQDYANRLQSAGFTVERINIAEQYPMYGLINDEDIFIGTK